MTEASEVSRVWGAVLRRWPIVLIAALIGAAGFALWSSVRAPEVGYTSSAKIRVADTSVPNMPTIDTVISYANSAKIKAAVEASSGLEATGVSVSAAADPKDKRGIVIKTRAPKADAAEAWADAAAEQARANALEMLGSVIGLEEARSSRLKARAEALKQEVASTKALAAKTKDAQAQADYVISAQTLEDTLAGVLESVDVSRFTLQGYRAWVSVTPASSASKVSSEGVVLSDVLRGGLVGLFIGVLIAALLENRRSS